MVGVADDVLRRDRAVPRGCSPCAPAPTRLLASLAGLRPRAVRLQGTRRLVVVGELPLTPMMKVDPVRRGAGRARRGGVGGGCRKSSPRRWGARQWPHRSRRRKGSMSPTQQWESDPDGHPHQRPSPLVVTAAALRARHRSGSGHRARHPAPPGRRGSRRGLPRCHHGGHRDRGCRNQHEVGRGRRAGHRSALRRHRRGRRRCCGSPSRQDWAPSPICATSRWAGSPTRPSSGWSGWEKIIAVNLKGTFLMCRALLPGMLEHGGAIVTTIRLPA